MTSFLLVAAFLVAPAADIRGTVVSVADGDTVTVLDGQQKQHRIRLAEIDAPEKGQPFGKQAKQVLSRWVFGKEVVVRVEGRDRYGRTIGTIFAGGANVNEALLLAGVVWVYRRYSKTAAYLSIEDEARRRRIGLWSQSDPTPPWEFRRHRRSGARSARGAR